MKPTLIEDSKGSVVEQWQQISCGGFHTVGVNRDGSLVSWGKGDRGQLGHEDNNYEDRTEPKIIDMPLLSNNVKYVNCRGAHTCVLTTVHVC